MTELEPPAWEEQEWCDGGATCHHFECVRDFYAELDPGIEVVPGGLRMTGQTGE